MFILFPFKTVHHDIYCLQLFMENEFLQHLIPATFCIKVVRKISQLWQLFLPATISAYKVLTQQIYDNNGYLFINILSEVAQEHNNNDPSKRLSTPHMGLKHTHPRPNSRHDTYYNNIAVTSLATIQPKGMWIQTPSI